MAVGSRRRRGGTRAGGSPLPRVTAERLRALELRARETGEALMHGEARSLLRGVGLEPRSVRSYVPGDDARAVDWRVTARLGSLHVRELEEDRELAVLLVFDRSASLHGSDAPWVGPATVECAASLAWIAARDGHALGLVTFGARAGRPFPPSRARDRLRRVLAALLAGGPGGRPDETSTWWPETGRRKAMTGGSPTDLATALDLARALVPARGLVLVVSDFLGSEQDRAATALARLLRRHTVAPVLVRAPALADAPGPGALRVVDPETRRGRWVRVPAGVSGPDARPSALPECLHAVGLRPWIIDPAQALVPQLARHLVGDRRGSGGTRP